MKRTLLITVLSIAVIISIAASVFATTPDINVLAPTTNTTNEIQNTTNIVANDTTPEKLASTGISTSVLPMMVIFIIASIYAYKKVREYNV